MQLGRAVWAPNSEFGRERARGKNAAKCKMPIRRGNISIIIHPSRPHAASGERRRTANGDLDFCDKIFWFQHFCEHVSLLCYFFLLFWSPLKVILIKIQRGRAATFISIYNERIICVSFTAEIHFRLIAFLSYLLSVLHVFFFLQA